MRKLTFKNIADVNDLHIYNAATFILENGKRCGKIIYVINPSAWARSCNDLILLKAWKFYENRKYPADFVYMCPFHKFKELVINQIQGEFSPEEFEFDMKELDEVLKPVYQKWEFFNLDSDYIKQELQLDEIFKSISNM